VLSPAEQQLIAELVHSNESGTAAGQAPAQR
jgi:hypothetical protein